MNQMIIDKINDAYVEVDGRTYLSSDMMRSQVEGLIEHMLKESLSHFNKKDFSHTGAARTIALDVKRLFKSCLKTIPVPIPEPILDR